MAFEREYVLVSIDWADRCEMTKAINAAVASHDHERAAADIACMETDSGQLHILIEKWRDVGDSKQDTTGTVDRTPAPRKSRRARSSEDDNARAAAAVEQTSLDYRVGDGRT